MIYVSAGIIVENKEQLTKFLEYITNYIEIGCEKHVHLESPEGFAYKIREDPCWDYDTPVEKHLELLI